MEKKLGLASVIATGVGLIVSTSCLMSLGQGAGALGLSFIITMAVACVFNVFTALCLSELNALMPNLTGGLAQYTLTCMGPFAAIVVMVGGYLVCNAVCGCTETAMFGNSIVAVFGDTVPPVVYSVAMLVFLIITNLRGIDMFAKVQNVVAYGLVISMVLMGLLGIAGLGTEEPIEQEAVISSNPKDIFSFMGLAFFLFLGCEFIIPIAKSVKNQKRSVPLGMMLSLLIVCVMQTLVVCGMSRYTKWGDLASSTTPHIFYGTSLLGTVGSVWMLIVSLFAVVSTVNSVISSLAYICAGMAKIGLLPAFFENRNKSGAPYVGIIMVAGFMIIANITGLSTSDRLSFMILVGSVFWLVAYTVSDINVLILRRRLPKAPRSFKVPLGPVIPVLGILGNLFMIWNISGDSATRIRIYIIDGIVFLILALYAVFWIHFKMKRPLFKSVPLHEVMAMENDLYMVARERDRAEERKARAEQ